MIGKMLNNSAMGIASYVTQKKEKRDEFLKIHEKNRKWIWESVELSATQKNEIDDFYMTHLGQKIPYEWHREYTAYTGNFDVKYFPEFLYIPEVEKYFNQFDSYCEVFENKNILPIFSKNIGVSMPKTIVGCRKGIYFTEEEYGLTIEDVITVLRDYPDTMFYKPSVDSNSGRGCRLIKKENIEKINMKFIQKLGNDFVIQEKVNCSNEISRLYSGSVNTFRVVTYRWHEEIHHMRTIMRIGQGGAFVDNAHAGGMFIGVKDNGELMECAFTEMKKEYYAHPDTEICFKGYIITSFYKVLDVAMKMHKALPEIGLVNWDFSLDKNNNPILIEANINSGSIWLTQMANGVGGFGDDTADILNWIRVMRKTKRKNRREHMFGAK